LRTLFSNRRGEFAMPISFQCDHCKRSYTTSEQWAGKTVKCKQCGQAMKVPSAAEPAAAPAPSAVDVYGLADADKGQVAEPPAAGAMPPRGSARAEPSVSKPMTKIPMSSSRKPRQKSAKSAGFFGGVSGTTVVLLLLLAVRMYRRYERNQARHPRPANQAATVVMPEGNAEKKAESWTMLAFSPVPPLTELDPGVMFSEIQLGRDQGNRPPQPGHGGKLWLYLPGGQHAPKSLPCVLIAGAGSNLITGMDLSDGDRPEHLPHVRAGFAVVAYELDGAPADKSGQNMQALARSSAAFLNAQAGLINARVAIEYAITQVPAIDPKRLYAVGHSSAATLALLVAENEPRLAGCVAFAPAVDITAQFAGPAQRAITQLVPGAEEFFTRYNPRANESKIGCPLFLFYADDDDRFASEVRDLAARLQASGKPVTVSHVASGGHYDSMINEGVPRAIEWLKALPSSGRAAAGS
jgi:acetyl esterase/lipase